LYQQNTGFDGCLVQMNLNGDVLKEQSFHSTLDDRFRCLDVAHGELMVGGDAGDFDNRSMIWMRTNLNQSLKDSWKLTYGAPFTNYVYCVSPKKSGNWLLTGEFTAPNVLRDGGMVITDSITGGNCLGEAFPFQVSPLSLNHSNLNVIRTENNRTVEETSVQVYTLPLIQAEDVCNEIPPKAQFAYTAKPNCPEVCVDFSDSSLCNIQEWFWEFESGIPAISTEQNPSVCFPGDGYYEVRLIVKNDGGSDTLISQVILNAGCDLPAPNAISPNGDGFNEKFIIPGLAPNSALSIFNRWGNVVFQSDAYDDSWTGKSDAGLELPEGVYFYTVQTPDGQKYSGYVSLFR
jgi:gliding motility-associated-like protein